METMDPPGGIADEPPTLADLPPHEAREHARTLWRDSGGTLKAPAAADRFGMSERWWRNQIRSAQGADNGTTGTPEPNGIGTTSARPPVPTRAEPARPTVPRPAPAARSAARPARGKPAGSVAVRRVTVVAVTIVSLVAFAASYSHMFHLALEAGEGELVARALPLSVDGLVLAATMALLSARGAGRDSGALPWLALLLGLGASLAANVAAAEPTLVGRLVAAWPPVALALSFELLLRQTRGEVGAR